ncbi:hypothetical protein FS837_012312 [Tulasnella sp. UAMH 9824]|nr:hypothetical protein FS837_012312 [Tulasnella sp. UAMH 9824]
MASTPGAGPASKKLKLEEDGAGSSETQNKAERKKAKKAKKAGSKAFNPQNIKHFVVLQITGITHERLSLNPSPTLPRAYPIGLPPATDAEHLKSLHKLFSHGCPSRAPGDQTRMHSALSTFLNVPVSAEEKVRRVKERNKQQSNLAIVNDPSVFVLTPAQMSANGYTLPSYIELPPETSTDSVDEATNWVRLSPKRDESWVETPQAPLLDLNGKPPKQKVWALDCEMIETTRGKELGRISIVDFDSSCVIFDSLVKPTNPVTSYLTQYSGLSEELLSKATLTLADIQQKLLSPGMIDSWTILVGHSLENDLGALKLAHPRVIDTSVIYHHTKGPPAKPGLKWLAQKWLGKTIQASEGGHDSREDATTCVELLKKKMHYGVNFGRFDHDQESIFEVMTRKDKRSAYIGAGANVVASKATTRVDCDNDVEIMEAVISNIATHDVVFARLQQLSYALEWSTPFRPRSALDTPAAPPPDLNTTLTNLDSAIARLHASLPAYTALCIFTGHSDPRRMIELNKRKSQWDNLTRGTGGKLPSEIPKEEWWTAQDGRNLEDESERAKKGLVFFCITLPKAGASAGANKA